MKRTYDGWTDFILSNWIDGTATEIALHIEKKANEQGFMPKNKTKQATVRRFLPESASNAPRTSKTRIVKRDELWYDYSKKIYRKKSQIFDENILFLNNEKQVKTRVGSDEKISILTPKDKSQKHDDMLKVITDYARENGFNAEPEKDGIDLLLEKDGKFKINEVKTYSNSIYVAVGQVQFYKYELLLKNKLNPDSIKNMNIIGNFQLTKKFEGFLSSLNINYIHIDEKEKIIL